jgi:predicted amidohydrolase
MLPGGNFIRRALSAVAAASSAAATMALLAGPAHAQELMPPDAGAWSPFAPRSVSAPATSVSPSPSGYALNISGQGIPDVYGGWRTRLQGLQGSAFYRFRARATPLDVPSLRESVTILLWWRGAFGEEVAPDYVWNFAAQPDGSVRFDRIIQAPAGTTAVDVELILQWAPTGQVAFDELSFATAAPPPPRPVRVAAIHYRPSGTSSGLESVQRAAAWADQVAAAHDPDIMLVGELLNVIGAPGSYDSKAETIPGPSTDVMAQVAAAHGTWIVFGMLEREGSHLYNTAVLIDRGGIIRGRYRKVQLPLSEAGAGIRPGDAIQIFTTDFGRVALLICHDLSFPEPVREAALNGAEMILSPFWGGRAPLVRARAVETGLHVATSGYDYPSEIVNPLGAVLATTTVGAGPQAAVAVIDLARRFREDWLGDWRDISSKERRTAPYPCPLPDSSPTPGALGMVSLSVTGYDAPTGRITLQYDPACGATDHAVHVGSLDGVGAYTYDQSLCGLGTSGAAEIDVGSGNRFWVLVGRDALAEGSAGVDSSGNERPGPPPGGACTLPQRVGGVCPLGAPKPAGGESGMSVEARMNRFGEQD